jgi:N-acetylmuramoyl-L-alanine amidase CwlA
MEEIITFSRILIVGIISLVLFALVQEADAKDYSQYKELYMANEAGGWIVVSVEECKLGDDIKKDFPNRAYATEPDGTMHEGCWDSPSIQDAPIDQRLIKIIPLVNVKWHTGDITVYEQNQFKPTKQLENSI